MTMSEPVLLKRIPTSPWGNSADRHVVHYDEFVATGGYESLRKAIEMKREDVLLKMENRGIPAGPINTVKQALTDPQIAARGMVVDLDEDGLQGLRTPIRFSDADLSIGRPSPTLPKVEEEE